MFYLALICVHLLSLSFCMEIDKESGILSYNRCIHVMWMVEHWQVLLRVIILNGQGPLVASI